MRVHKGSLATNQPLGPKIEGDLDREHARSEGLRDRGIRGDPKANRFGLHRDLVPILVQPRTARLAEAANGFLDAHLAPSGPVLNLVEGGLRIGGQRAG
jgi:hypothetical protein